MSIANLLKRVQLFANLEANELEQLAAICQEKKIAGGETIISQNTTGNEMYIVAQGSVEVFIQGLEDARSLVVLGKGQVIGEMALIDQGYRSASVRTTREGATLYLIESDAFYKLCEENNHIGFIVMRNLAIDIAFKLRHRNLAEL
ncbi:MAG: cyclic nucleotide-binding domain-containing protein [Anaerolineales bacterium]|nr:cyclic nucleotide-binding domain-containing protein [Anaerolineales bacterium]MCB8940070.1 cyclic nucleotide-binding domain-containing protein [Ardenticatenaceae bacterium]